MKILFVTAGNETLASSRTRVFQYLPYFAELGIKTSVLKYNTSFQELWNRRLGRILSHRSASYWLFARIGFVVHVLLSRLNDVRLLVLAWSFDVVVLQKVLPPILVQRIVVRLQRRLVFDFDDAVYMNQNKRNSVRLEILLSRARLVVVSNDVLEQYARRFCVKSLRIVGPIDCSRYRPRKSEQRPGTVTIGWIGSVPTTQYLELVRQPLQEIMRRHANVMLELIGAGPFATDGLRLKTHRWSLNSEVELLEHFDVGIMPLLDDEWSRGKGGYKILQYMAMGIPSIASPVGINSVLIEPGVNGYLASTAEEWLDKLELVLRQDDLRVRIGAQSRMIALREYSTKESFPKLLRSIENT